MTENGQERTITGVAGMLLAFLELFADRDVQIGQFSLNQMDSISPVVSLLKDVAQIFALVIGGGWVLWNYVLSRTHVPRLQPDLAAERLSVNGRHYIRAFASIENPGQALVEIRTKGTALIVESASSSTQREDAISALVWHKVAAFDVFLRHPSIEPGLVFEEQLMIEVPASELPKSCKLTLRVVVPSAKFEPRSYRRVVTLPPAVLPSGSDPDARQTE